MTQTVVSPLFTLKEAMTYLKVSRSTIYRLMWGGQLAGYKVGTNWRFLQSDVRNYLRAQRYQPTETPDTLVDAVHQQI